MKGELKRIDRIINNLLLYARPTKTEALPYPAAVLEDVLHHVLTLLKAQKLFDGITIKEDLEGGPWKIAIASDDLTQLLINLMLNAAEAMKGQGEIRLSAERLSGWRPSLGVVARDAVRISVADSGPGIPPGGEERIFDPFYSNREGSEGSGLGLAICQSICERAGGEIALDRQYTAGSRFLITLAVAR